MVDFSKRELRRKSQSLPVREAQKNFIAGTFLLSNKNRRFKGRVTFFEMTWHQESFFGTFFCFFFCLAVEVQKKKR